MKQIRAGRSLAVFLILTLSGVILFIAHNALFDPYGMVHHMNFSSKGEFRKCGYDLRRTVKSAQIYNGPWDGLLIGNSRVEIGMDPDRPVYQPYRYYNAALPAGNWEEYKELIRFARKHAGIRHIVISLDIVSMTRKFNPHSSDFLQSPVGGGKYWKSILNYLFSYKTFYAARQWERVPFGNHNRVCKYNGSRYYGLREVSRINYEKRFESGLKSMDRRFKRLPRNYRFFKGRKKEISNIIAGLLRSGVKVDLFIPPLHSKAQRGLFHAHPKSLQTFHNFRREMITLIEAVQRYAKRRNLLGTVTLWDFTGNNEVTMEPVPGVDIPKGSRMRWYSDPTHITKEHGDLIFCRVVQGRSSACKAFGDLTKLGVQIHSGMIDEFEIKQNEQMAK